MKLKTIAGTALLALALGQTAYLTTAQAADNDPRPWTDDPLLFCGVHGTIPQPPGSPINACCNEDGCYICDQNFENCHWEPARLSLPGDPGSAGLPDSMYDGPVTMPLPDLPTRFNR